MRKTSLFAAILSAVVVSSACTRVGPGYVGVKVSMAGDTRGVDSNPAVTGWVFYNPFLSTVYEWPTFVQQVVLTKDPHEGNPANEEITFTNADQMVIAADISFAYTLDGEKVPYFFQKFRTDDMTQFSHGYLRSLIRDKFNEIAGKYKIESIMGDNATFIAEVKAAVQKDVTEYGVVLEPQFGFIGAPRPPQAVIDMINAKVGAVQLAQQKQNELVQVQADMAKEREKTDTYARNTLTLAEAQSTANRKIADSITPTLIQLRQLEKWNGELPYINGGSTNPFISLTK